MTADCHQTPRNANFSAFFVLCQVIVFLFERNGIIRHLEAMSKWCDTHRPKCVHFLAADTHHLV